jgi:hypothetical protein
MKKIAIRFLGTLIILNFLACGNAFVRIKISPLPQPPATDKLRIFVLAVTDAEKRVNWQVSPEKFNENMTEKTSQILKTRGIYEVVSEEDIKAVLGNQTVTGTEWYADDNALAKDVGRALHADYALLIERRAGKTDLHFSFDLINLNTGKLFHSFNYVSNSLLKKFNDSEKTQAIREVIRNNYRQMFNVSKGDLLNTAMAKGKLLPEKIQTPVIAISPAIETVTPDNSKEETLSDPKKIASSRTAEPIAAAEKNVQEKQIKFEKELEKTILAKNKKEDGTRLIVYDFDTAERLRIIGMILAEALREELLKLGGFVLINRENMVQVMDEYKLQHSGLVDEKQSIKIGQWLAANEAVTGMLALLGATSVLQAKRIDIKKMNTISLGSLKCEAGKEDELLNNMSLLARKLIQPQK